MQPGNRETAQPAEAGRLGEKTTEEMCIAFVDFLKASDYSPKIEN